MTEERQDVFHAINTERNYQIAETEKQSRLDMVPEFDMAHALLCIEEFTRQARENWYKDNPSNKYGTVTPLLRKIAGVCVNMGEKYGMPTR